MRTALVALLSGAAFLVWALFVWVAGFFVAKVARFRRYRKIYPAADQGRVWKHVG